MGKKRVTVKDLAEQCGISVEDALKKLRDAHIRADGERYKLRGEELTRARSVLGVETESHVEPPSGNDDMAPAPSGLSFDEVVDDWLASNEHIKKEQIEWYLEKYSDEAPKRGTNLQSLSAEEQESLKSDLAKLEERIRSMRLKRAHEKIEKERAEAERKEAERKAEEAKRAEEEARRKAEERAKREAAEAARREAERKAQEAERERREAERKAQAAAEEAARRENVARARKEGAWRLAQFQSATQQSSASSVSGLLKVLNDRIMRARNLLFGDKPVPSYDLITYMPDLSDGSSDEPVLLKRLMALTFGEDVHPEYYHDPFVIAYYTLRYELGYAFEYSQVYGLLLDLMGEAELTKEDGSKHFGVLSVGCGQGIDYWGLRYALAARNMHDVSLYWRGVDLEEWPSKVLDDSGARYYDNTDILVYLERLKGSMPYQVLMFPKVITELPTKEVIEPLAAWLSEVRLTRNVHYVCFVHTDRSKFVGDDGSSREFSENNERGRNSDAYKSALLIRSLTENAEGQGYSVDKEWTKHLPNPSLGKESYEVDWSDAGIREKQFGYLVYPKDEPVWTVDTKFRRHPYISEVQAIGRECCPEYKADEESGQSSEECKTKRRECSGCRLYRFPRYKTGLMAYQILRLVKKEGEATA